MAASAPRRRVLLLADSPYFGGITTHLLSIIDAFAEHPGYAIQVASFPGRRPDRALLEACEARGIAAHVVAMRWAYDPGVVNRLGEWLRESRIDLIHTHNYRATLLASRAAAGLPVVNTSHGMAAEPSWRLRAWQALELRAMRGFPLTLAVSHFVRQWLIARGLRPERVRTVHNAAPAPPDGPPADRACLGIPPDAFVAAYVGRLVEAKGLDVFLRALSGAKGVVGVLVGDGPMRRRLERMARDVGADVRFAGRVAAPAAFYRMANVVVLPSQMEALPMSLIEAAACGAPAIGTRAGGIPEVIEDDESGLLVPPGDPDALRRAIERLRDEPAARRRLGEGARAVWRERFTPERLAAELTRAYDDTLAAKAGERRGAEPGPQS